MPIPQRTQGGVQSISHLIDPSLGDATYQEICKSLSTGQLVLLEVLNEYFPSNVEGIPCMYEGN